MDRSRPGRKGISREPTQEEIDARKKRRMDARMEAHEKNKTGPFRETPGRAQGMNRGTMVEKEKSEKIKDAYRRRREEKPERRITREDIKIEKLNVGGMCRGMGAAIRGGKFEGVK